jgi:hypothetical protein
MLAVDSYGSPRDSDSDEQMQIDSDSDVNPKQSTAEVDVDDEHDDAGPIETAALPAPSSSAGYARPEVSHFRPDADSCAAR